METQTKRSRRQLKVILTEQEKVRAAEEMARADGELTSLEQEKKEYMDGWKARAAAAGVALSSAALLVRQGYEWRQVEVDMLLDHENRKVTIYRMDTAELVEEREMYDSEMQADLFEEESSMEDKNREALELGRSLVDDLDSQGGE